MKDLIKNLFKKAAKRLIYVYSIIFYRRNISTEKCDILMLHPWSGRIKRAKPLVAALKKEGLIVRYDINSSIGEILLHRLLYKPKKLISIDYSYFEYYSAYLIKKYNPRIVITFTESSRLLYFLKRQLEAINGKLINMAHAVTPAYPESNIYESHYFFVFGQSSVKQALKKKSTGNTKMVKVGSFFMNFDEDIKINRYSKKILFISQGQKTNMEEANTHNVRNLKILSQWAEKNTDYKVLIKYHPLEDTDFTRSLFKDSKFTFLPKNITMVDALKDVALVILRNSNTSLEASLLKRPVVLLNDDDKSSSYLELEQYFLPHARNCEELDYNIRETFRRYDEFIEKGTYFLNRHLEKTTDSISYIVHCIKSIINGEEDFEYIEISQSSNSPIL
jgi:hypothetical protein